MKNFTFDFQGLLPVFNRLEATIFHYRFTGYDEWLINELEEEDLESFIAGLYKLSHECLCMHLTVDAPVMPPYISHHAEPVSKADLIRLTRELIFCCDMEVIGEYRDLGPGEYELIRFLEIMHAQFIGDLYWDHPGMETLSSPELGFYEKE